ncbi:MULTISPECIES: hypothetical protein [unclassified Carboxylicivirga]|uniref:hypothetical protein n=1 Tax=Carboxylicivirga TaxID=1628153 RepID=UPI003D33B2C7
MLNKILFKDRGASLIMGMLLLFFISDALNVILSHTNYFATFPISAHIKLSAITKGMAMVCIVSYFLWYKKYLPHIGLTLLLVSFFALVGINFSDNTHLFTWLIRLFKLALPFVLYYFIKDRSIPQRSYVFKLFAGLILLQCITVIAAFIFDWPVFLTYGSHRFGYSGFLIAQNEANFFYVIAFVFLWAQYNNTGHKLYVFSLVTLLLASALLGAKAILSYMPPRLFTLFLLKSELINGVC